MGAAAGEANEGKRAVLPNASASSVTVVGEPARPSQNSGSGRLLFLALGTVVPGGWESKTNPRPQRLLACARA